MKAPYIRHADFESRISRIQVQTPLDPDKSGSQKTSKHDACGYSYIVVVRCDGQTEQPVMYRGPDAAKKFLRAL